jgi:putative PIN family toxin of toxin-antitoxin system
MRKAVIDTNVIVSALLNPEGAPAGILSLFLNGKIEAYYDARILHEYIVVLSRPKFPFDSADVDSLIDTFQNTGVIVAAEHVEAAFIDKTDRKFFEVAKTADAMLVTGNSKHFPADPLVISPADFLRDSSVTV